MEGKPGLLRSYNGFEELVSRASWEEAREAHQVFVLLFWKVWVGLTLTRTRANFYPRERGLEDTLPFTLH